MSMLAIIQHCNHIINQIEEFQILNKNASYLVQAFAFRRVQLTGC